MNKPQFVEAVAAKSGLAKKDAENAVNSVLEVIAETLAEGDKVQFVGFGTFEAKIRAAHNGRNPLTNETMEIPEKRVPAFKAGLGLKERISK